MKRILVVYIFLLSTSVAFAQKVDLKNLQTISQKAINNAYLPSIRMWGYDTAARQRTSAQFSGVVVSADGYILTAAHVTTPGTTYKVMFANGSEAIARALGKIELAEDRTIPDVALMKIVTPGTWPYAQMARSAGIKVNEPCISIAYPESLNQSKPTVRFGRIAVVKNDRGFIVSTCKMEPGDSGGPLFDYLGRVIGLHSAINTDEDTNYEIPVDLYLKYWNALNKEQVYTAMPADTQQVSADNTKILTIAGLANMQLTAAGISKKQHFNNQLAYITSRIDTGTIRICGTLINVKSNKTDGYIASKSSMVGDQPMVTLANGKSFTAKIIARDRDNDLVLLQIPFSTEKGVITEPVKINENITGLFLVTPLPNQQAIASIAGSQDISLPRYWSLGYLGAAIGYDATLPVLTYVQPNSPAAKSDLMVDDQIIAINGIKMNRNEDFAAELQKYWPGDTMKFQISRNGQEHIKTLVLGKRLAGPAKHPAELFKGGKSSRRDGFTGVFTHDAALLPEQCGSPVFDIEGNFIGINTARFSRTTTLAVPAAVVSKFVANSLAK